MAKLNMCEPRPVFVGGKTKKKTSTYLIQMLRFVFPITIKKKNTKNSVAPRIIKARHFWAQCIKSADSAEWSKLPPIRRREQTDLCQTNLWIFPSQADVVHPGVLVPKVFRDVDGEVMDAGETSNPANDKRQKNKSKRRLSGRKNNCVNISERNVHPKRRQTP